MSRARSGLNPPPRGFTTDEARRELNRERMIRSVTEGRPGTAMVGWGKRLSSEQIEALVDYIRGRFMRVAEAAPAPDAGPAPDLPMGRQVYRRHCASCHGDQGTGASWTANSLNPPPRDFTNPGKRAELTRARMLESVTHGRPGTAMMPFVRRLSEQEIAAVVDYIRIEFMAAGQAPGAAPAPETAGMPRHPDVEPLPDRAPMATLSEGAEVAADMSLPFSGGLAGDPDKGGAFYKENCHVCHGEDGDGRGVRASFIEPAPRDFLSADSRRTLNRPTLFTAIAEGRRGTVMPAWKTVLSEQEIADVAEYVFQTYIRSGPDVGEDDAALSDETKKKALD